jgi:hypothetical protein
MRSEIIKTIKLIRDSFDGSVEVYSKGSCIKFAMILKHLYPNGTILYDSNHAIFKFDEYFYDINGEVEKNKNHIPLEEYGILHSYDLMNLKFKMK